MDNKEDLIDVADEMIGVYVMEQAAGDTFCFCY